VADLIKTTPNAIGYVELTQAIQDRLTYGQVQNASGQFVKANLESVTAAAADSVATMPADFRVSITNPPGERAYPVASFTWALVPSKISDPMKKHTVVAFLTWALTDGQSETEALSYARLPATVIDKAKPVVEQIQ
jgi:phosphate transport system substrate-binding protein